MLTTLLSIGRTLRRQPGAAGIRHHRYIRPAPEPGKGQALLCFEVSVSEEMEFDIHTARPIEDEAARAELFYLNYKTSDSDTMKKYLFGDICRYQVKKPKDTVYSEAEANFLLGASNAKPGSAYQLNSFERARPDAEDLQHPGILAFRASVERQMPALLEWFRAVPSLYLNFRFKPDRRHWYELEGELAVLNAKMLKEFVAQAPEDGYVLTKFLHKTLAADKGAMPGFRLEHAYKSWRFSGMDAVSDLLYAIDFSKQALIRKGDIKIVVLPRSDEDGVSMLTAQDITQFFRARGVAGVAKQEASKAALAAADEPDEFDEPYAEEDETLQEAEEGDELARAAVRAADSQRITRFDFIFSKASASPSAPDIDVIELSGITRSRISELDAEIREIRKQLENERTARFAAKGVTLKKPLPPLRVLSAFNSVLGDIGRDKKKYGSHLLKTLPQIYCGTYVRDELLMPAFIAVIERGVREGSPYYDTLRYDLLFLLKLQDVNRKDKPMLTKIKEDASYRAGLLLGKMARPLRVKINSFEKNYVGLLSRRVAQTEDLVAFMNYIDSKLTLHDVAYPSLKEASRELAALVCEFDASENIYNREYCVFGFFESYFQPAPKKTEGATSAREDGEDDEADEADEE